MKILALLLAAAAIAVVVAGVLSDDDSSSAPPAATRSATPAPSTGGPAGTMLAPKIAGEGLSIAEALVAETPESLLVRGYLISDAGGLRLCTGLEGGKCVAPALAIEGEPGIEPDGPEPVAVLGELDGRTLVVVNLAAA